MKRIFLLMLIISFSLSCCNMKPNHYEKGKYNLIIGNYQEASKEFDSVPLNSKNRDSAIILKKYCDSLYQVAIKKELELKNEKSLKEGKKYLHELTNFDSIVSKYRFSLNNLTAEVAFFWRVSEFIAKNSNSKDVRIVKLSKQLKKQLIYRQKIEFPKIRKEGGRLMDAKLWIKDIDVYTRNLDYKDNDNSILVFTGSIFVSHQNISDFQVLLESRFKTFRYSTVKYKWYKYDKDITTFYLGSPEDTDIDTTSYD